MDVVRQNANTITIRVQYDNRPDEVADKFSEALEQFGITVKNISGDEDETQTYELKKEE